MLTERVASYRSPLARRAGAGDAPAHRRRRRRAVRRPTATGRPRSTPSPSDAGVSRKTVFTLGRAARPSLLKLAFDWTLAGDDEPVRIGDRPEVQQMMRERGRRRPCSRVDRDERCHRPADSRRSTTSSSWPPTPTPRPPTCWRPRTDQRADGARSRHHPPRRPRRPPARPRRRRRRRHRRRADRPDALSAPRRCSTAGTFEAYVEHLQRITAASLLR